MAAKLTAEMFRAAANGGLELQLVYYRGEQGIHRLALDVGCPRAHRRHVRVRCAAGPTQIGRVLAHAHTENRRSKIAAVVLVSDACEEDPTELYAAARQLDGVPVFLFQEGTDEWVATVYRTIATITGGASCRFDAGAAARLGGSVAGRRRVRDWRTQGPRRRENRSSAVAARSTQVKGTVP